MTKSRFSLAALNRLMLVALGSLLVAGCNSGGYYNGLNPGTTSTPTPTPAANNSTALTAGFGPNGPAGGYYNGVFTSVTICAPGTSNCQTVDNVLVDTGSIGLRVLSSALTTLPQTSLGAIQDNTQDQLQECTQYGDTSYSWGPMWLADVKLGGEKASGVPIQVIGGNAGSATFATVPQQCLTTPVNSSLPNGGNEDTVATLGANGILGIGSFASDCGSYCASTSNTGQSGFPYYICPAGQPCAAIAVPTQYQAANPVAFFSSSDSNGVMITFPSVPPSGAASVSGTMNFGVGTQSDNALSNQTVFALDGCGNFPTISYNNAAYSDTFCNNGSGGYGGFLDTGSNGLFILDAATLGISDCTDNGYYCPGNTLTLSNISISGYGGVGSGTVSLSIANADQLFGANPTFAVFSNLGGDSGTGPTSDYFDFGLPFFLGRTVFVGIAGTATPNNVSAPNGFVAF